MASSSSNKSSQASTNTQNTTNSDSSLNAQGSGSIISNSTINTLDAGIATAALKSNADVSKAAFDFSSDVAGNAIDRSTSLARDLAGQTADVAGNAIDRSTSLARDLAGQNANVATNALDFSNGLTRELLGGFKTTVDQITSAYQKSQADNSAFQVGLVERFAQSSDATASTLRDALSATLKSDALAKPADRGEPIDTTPASEKNTPLIWAAVGLGLVIWGNN